MPSSESIDSPDLFNETKSIARLARFSAKFALAVMILGASVRATDSGLACPDWPLCFGTAIPYFDTRIFLEWFHRLIAGLFSVSVLYLGFRIFRSPMQRRRFTLMIVTICLLLAWQIILGALTVLELLNSKIVSWHLMNAVVLYMVLETISAKASSYQIRKTDKSVQISARVYPILASLTGFVFLQLLVGGMVSTNEAGLMCPDFPKCFGSWWPNVSWLSSLQMVHRFVGMVIAVISVAAVVKLARTPLPLRIRRAVSIVPLLVIAQIILGVINVLWFLPVWASVGHLALALIIFSVLFVATVESKFYYDSELAAPVKKLGLSNCPIEV